MFEALMVLCKVTVAVSLRLCQGPYNAWGPFPPKIVQSIASAPSGLPAWWLLIRQVEEGAPGKHGNPSSLPYLFYHCLRCLCVQGPISTVPCLAVFRLL